MARKTLAALALISVLFVISVCMAQEQWASETQGSAAAAFRFRDGERGWATRSGLRSLRALPVCSGK